MFALVMNAIVSGLAYKMKAARYVIQNEVVITVILTFTNKIVVVAKNKMWIREMLACLNGCLNDIGMVMNKNKSKG